MTVATLQQAISLNPLQQWRYFSQPRVMHDWLRERYGDFAALHFQGRNFTAILTAEGARQVFTADPDGYDAFWKESFAGLNGEGSLWVLVGEKHRRERQLFAPAVHANHFRAYGNTIRDITRQNIKKWQPGQTVRAIDTTLAISLDIIMRLVFGVEEEQLMAEGREVLEALRGTVHPLIVFYPALQRPWFPPWRRYARARENMHAWVDRLLTARRARGGDASDVLGSLMQARDENGNPISDAHIRNELGSILGAGHETTATALAWALYELGRHPAVLAKLRAELASAGQEADTGVIIKLPYLSAVCNETVRLHPILAECARVPTQPLEILGHTIPAGQALVISIVGIHHNPAIYPEPDRFLPERFIDRSYSVFEFLPFGGGHRRCLGAGLAEYSIRIALAEIVQHWDFEPAAVDHDIRHDIAMGPKNGVPLRIDGRRSQQDKMVLPGSAELFEQESLSSQVVHGK
jgi:cytochrome P450